jgi:hypothetical protein
LAHVGRRCDAKPECNSFENADAVLQTVSDDHKNALGKYAAENPNTASTKKRSSASARCHAASLRCQTKSARSDFRGDFG